jgi:hypothetical protein
LVWPMYCSPQLHGILYTQGARPLGKGSFGWLNTPDRPNSEM